MTMSLLKTSNCTMQFGGLTAVKNVSIELKKGEILCLVGPNGAGKTTLFNMITGFLESTKGEISLEGTNISNKPPFLRAKSGLIRTFQQNELFGMCNSYENVLIANHLKCGGWNSLKSLGTSLLQPIGKGEIEKRSHQRAQELLDFVGLGKKSDIKAHSLPHGDQRLLGIAVALAADPKILMLDEPVGGMTHAEASDVIELIYEIRSQGVTIFLIEHNMSVVMDIADRIYVMDQGEIIAEGKPAEIKSNPRVIEAYLGKWE